MEFLEFQSTKNKNHEKLAIPLENHEDHENHRLQRVNNENHENHRIPNDNH